MRFLITGIAGFVGRHLTARLLADGHAVFGTTRRPAAVAGIPLPDDHVAVIDCGDLDALTALIARLRPDGIFHLAAITSVPASLADPPTTYRVNFFGSLTVVAAMRAAGVSCRLAWVGSSDAYGKVEPDELPVTETAVLRPVSPYGVSKAAADLAMYQCGLTDGVDVVRLRPFNHTGPGQQPPFMCADFARQLVEIERGVRPPQLEVGNLDAVRDFTDVRDVVRAYELAWESGVAGEAYNVCSGTGRPLREIADGLLRASGVRALLVPRPERQRRVDVAMMVGSAEKLRGATGWSPVIDWEQTLRDLLEDRRRH